MKYIGTTVIANSGINKKYYIEYLEKRLYFNSICLFGFIFTKEVCHTIILGYNIVFSG